MANRTKTYIAGDWTGDQDLINQLYLWDRGSFWAFHFVDAHELTQARDTSLSCSIKSSLSFRMNASKTFVLIVGEKTSALTKGGCQYCNSYDSRQHKCIRGMRHDYRSFIQFECEKAVLDGLKIVVIYNYASVRREKCPSILWNKGTHVNGYYYETDGKKHWNYLAIKEAIMGK